METSYNHFESDIGVFASTYFLFLNELIRKEPNLEKIQDLHLELSDLDKKIKMEFKQLSGNPKSIKIFAKYVKIFNFDTLENARQLKRLKHFTDLAERMRSEER